MPKYLVLVERTYVDHYSVEAESVEEANQMFMDEAVWGAPHYSEELEAEVREEETQLWDDEETDDLP